MKTVAVKLKLTEVEDPFLLFNLGYLTITISCEIISRMTNEYPYGDDYFKALEEEEQQSRQPSEKTSRKTALDNARATLKAFEDTKIGNHIELSAALKTLGHDPKEVSAFIEKHFGNVRSRNR